MLVQLSIPEPAHNPLVPAQDTLRLAEGVTIATRSDYLEVVEVLKAIKSKYNALEGQRQELKAPTLESGRRIDNFFAAPLDFLRRAEAICKRKLTAYDSAQEQLRITAQRQADETARKAQEKLQQQAQKAQAAGKVEKAEVLLERADAVVAPIIARETPKAAGLSSRENWYAECTDLAALVAAVAVGTAPLSLLMANDKVLGQQARSLKKDFVVPGVRVWMEKSLAAGRL
ncbi:MAG TPA: hypothetical protein VK524_20345 [Polyangiaceae bacterium]|nr:hypothetical protein [Polyangiaceae bacterium]